MKNHLLDLVGHTHQLGTISTIKITGTDQETKIDAVADDKTVVVQGRFLAPIAEFIGAFGMPNLSKLNVILNIPEYQEDPRITLITRDEEDGTLASTLKTKPGTSRTTTGS